MNWTNFPFFAATAALLWILGIILLNFPGKRRALEITGNILIAAGLAVLVCFLTLCGSTSISPPAYWARPASGIPFSFRL
jgi:hypothetical protein